MRRTVFSVMILVLFLQLLSTALSAQYGYNVPALALMLIDEGRIDEAREELIKNRRSEPDNHLILFYLAKIEQDYDRALWMYKETELLANKGLAAEALYRRAEMIFSTGAYDDASQLYERLVNEYPDCPYVTESRYRLGLVRLKAGKPGDALSLFQSCMESSAETGIRLLVSAGIMECYVMMEDWENAMSSALNVLEERDEFGAVTPRVLEVLAIAWRKMGNDDNADKFIERLLTTYPYSYQAFAIRSEAERAADDIIMREGNTGGNIPVRELTSGGQDVATRKKGKFTVQAMAFKDRTRALSLMRRLTNAGLDARIEMKTVNNTHLFLVQVGYFPTREDAMGMQRRVSGVTGEQSIIVVLQ